MPTRCKNIRNVGLISKPLHHHSVNVLLCYVTFYDRRMRSGNVFSRISVCLCVCNALTFETLDLESSLFVCTFSGYLGQVCISRSSDQVEGHRSKKSLSGCPFSGFRFDLQTSFLIHMYMYIFMISRSMSNMNLTE